MKNKPVYFAIIFSLLLSSCGYTSRENFPVYMLTTIEYVPDNLKQEHRKFITETVRAGSQHMTGGDYEDVDETIAQAERTADRIFSIEVLGLEKVLYEGTHNAIRLEIKPSDFTPYEKQIFDSLSVNK